MSDATPSFPTIADPASFLDEARNARINLPLPGSGRTAERFDALRNYSCHNASVGRLVESHADAIAILHDARVAAPANAAMAVWSSDSKSQLSLHPTTDGYLIEGTKHFCGGAIIVDVALTTAMIGDELSLVLVDLHHPTVAVDPSAWSNTAFRDAGIATVQFASTPIAPSAIVAEPGFYGSRCGFWHGAVGVAAGWAGMLDALIDAMTYRRHDELAVLAGGELAALRWNNRAILAYAAQLIDTRCSTENVAAARDLALAARHGVRANCQAARQLIDHETGPAPLAFDAHWWQRRSELDIALLQSHGRRDIIQIA